ncbi:regulatory protein GemA [Diaphorobacter sp. HDW4A]|uniref:regulatory protein GemA n=1 Tax=Diaphorobacter sp. HDW4A TaxID=2714924 RepID=UPI00140CBC1E|nr:regulatory protein GemA [Diaphorobacter sp. HDW4A]QIL81775.1 regulatory protein GemA [Diaphorobacter sp. HDW4A]
MATTNHIAAIHTLKSQLQLSDGDYRALLLNLTGKSSSTDMNQAERTKVRDHMQSLAERMGVARPGRRGSWNGQQFARSKAIASPRERKVWALWLQLHRDGMVDNTSRAALDAWVTRTVHVSSLRFCTPAQLNTCIEALKEWHSRKPER